MIIEHCLYKSLVYSSLFFRVTNYHHPFESNNFYRKMRFCSFKIIYVVDTSGLNYLKLDNNNVFNSNVDGIKSDAKCFLFFIFISLNHEKKKLKITKEINALCNTTYFVYI